MSPLLDAIEHFDIERVRALLKAGADPNERKFDAICPLHLAVDIEAEDAIYRYDNYRDETPPNGKLIALLLQYGADVNAKDNQGQRALEWAIERKHQSAIALLSGDNAV